MHFQCFTASSSVLGSRSKAVALEGHARQTNAAHHPKHTLCPGRLVRPEEERMQRNPEVKSAKKSCHSGEDLSSSKKTRPSMKPKLHENGWTTMLPSQRGQGDNKTFKKLFIDAVWGEAALHILKRRIFWATVTPSRLVKNGNPTDPWAPVLWRKTGLHCGSSCRIWAHVGQTSTQRLRLKTWAALG